MYMEKITLEGIKKVKAMFDEMGMRHSGLSIACSIPTWIMMKDQGLDFAQWSFEEFSKCTKGGFLGTKCGFDCYVSNIR